MIKTKIKKNKQKQIALKRIEGLFELAYNKALNKNFKLADRYVCIARKISMKYLVSIPNKYKRCFCKHCYCYIFPNVNSRFRIKNGKIVIFCNNCEKFTRIPFKYKN